MSEAVTTDNASPSTTGIELTRGSHALREAIELVSSMRFSISLLTVICIASVIGTVVKQHEAMPSYVNQFGPFWVEVFDKLGLYSVYSAWWFMLILTFLVLSTSLCIARNAPKILVDLKTYKENVREQSLRAFGHKLEGDIAQTREAYAEQAARVIASRGYKIKLVPQEGATLIAAKSGAANKIGYLAAHGAIVLICIGGLLDGDTMTKAYMWATGKAPTRENFAIKDVPPKHTLPLANPTYRGNLFVVEGDKSDYALLNFSDGVMLQPLPIEVTLKKFIVEYYSTGMPKLFASDVTVKDKTTGVVTEGRIEVNKPLIIDGIALYQSSFQDGGSHLKLKGYPMLGKADKPFVVEGDVGGNTQIANGQSKLTLEFAGLRAINVENMSQPGTTNAVDLRGVDLGSGLTKALGEPLDKMTGSGANVAKTKKLQNIGPSVSYRLRDASGQAREYNNYMLPVELDGVRVYLAGLRDDLNDAFRYVRIPADENDGVDGFMLLRAALNDETMRAKAIERFAATAKLPQTEGKTDSHVAEQLKFSSARALDLFAGVVPLKAGEKAIAGLEGLNGFLEKNVPETERNNAADIFLRLLNGALYQLYQVARENAGLKPLETNESTQKFMAQAVLALSDSFVYGAPVYLKLEDYKLVQASVFQVARAPGKYLVYLGCALLILGVFTMLYVRERRLWLLIKSTGDGASSHALLAMSTTRKTMDFEREFEKFKALVIDPTPTAKESI